jgi:transcriptional regulator with XRE-family HTH domain
MLKGIIGTNIKNTRDKRGLKQVHLAKLAGLTPAAISQVECGKRATTTVTLYFIAKALGVSMDSLCDCDKDSSLDSAML